MEQYDPTKVSIIVAGHAVTGFAEGTKINAEREEDKRSAHVGVDGNVTFVKNANDLGRVTISLKHNSPSNEVLNALYKSDEEFEFAAIDMNEVGADIGVSGTRCVVASRPPFERGDEVVENEWELMVADYDGVFEGL